MFDRRKGILQKLAYSVAEVAERLGVSRNTVYRAAKKGDLPSMRVSGRLLIPRAALERKLEGAVDEANNQAKRSGARIYRDWSKSWRSLETEEGRRLM